MRSLWFAAQSAFATGLAEAPAVAPSAQAPMLRGEHLGLVLLALAFVSLAIGWHLAGTNLRARSP